MWWKIILGLVVAWIAICIVIAVVKALLPVVLFAAAVVAIGYVAVKLFGSDSKSNTSI